MAPGGADPRERRRRQRASWLVVLGRPALFVAWVGVFWGTLIALSLVSSAVEVGPREALARLLPRQASGWDYMNAGAALLALAAWVLVATVFVVNRRRQAAP